MKPSILALFSIALFCGALAARAQVVPSAYGKQFRVDVGGEGSAFQPDYAGTQIATTSPNRLYGVGVYVDVRFNRWVQLEAEGRWSRFNQFSWNSTTGHNGEDTYMIGPRVPIHTFHHFTPYGKVLFGFGSGSFLDGHAATMAFGGGVDYRLNRRFTLRAFDLEYQRWNVNPTLWPYGGSVGLSYKVF